MTRRFVRAIWVVILILPGDPCRGQGAGAMHGLRVDLTEILGLDGPGGQRAQLIVPESFVPRAGGRYDLVVHFHGASSAAERALSASRVNAILFSIHLGSLSSPYRLKFEDSAFVSLMLRSIEECLSSGKIADTLVLDRLIVSSFSAGYAGVREMLKSSRYYDLIDALILVDGLHSDLDSSIMVNQMKDFLRFARDARDRQKVFLISRSSIRTEGYRSTTETAQYLMQGIGGLWRSVSDSDEIGSMVARCDTGYFHLCAYAGDTAADHVRHLRGMESMISTAVDLLDRGRSHSGQILEGRKAAARGGYVRSSHASTLRHSVHQGVRRVLI